MGFEHNVAKSVSVEFHLFGVVVSIDMKSYLQISKQIQQTLPHIFVMFSFVKVTTEFVSLSSVQPPKRTEAVINKLAHAL